MGTNYVNWDDSKELFGWAKFRNFSKTVDAMPAPVLNLSDPTEICETLLRATELLFSYEGRVGSTHHIQSEGNILVSGDLHDNPLHLARIIKLAALREPTNRVVLQELIHSGNTSVLILSGLQVASRIQMH